MFSSSQAGSTSHQHAPGGWPGSDQNPGSPKPGSNRSWPGGHGSHHGSHYGSQGIQPVGDWNNVGYDNAPAGGDWPQNGSQRGSVVGSWNPMPEGSHRAGSSSSKRDKRDKSTASVSGHSRSGRRSVAPPPVAAKSYFDPIVWKDDGTKAGSNTVWEYYHRMNNPQWDDGFNHPVSRSHALLPLLADQSM